MNALAIIPAAGTLAIVPSAPALTFSIPHDDGAEFWGAHYSDKVRAEVRRWLHILSRIQAAGNARGVRVRAMQAEARLANVSFGSVRQKWYAYERADGDWRVLVRRSLKGSGTAHAANDNLPAAFRDEVARRMAQNKRSRKRAYQELIVQWRRWRRHGLAADAIPGYATAPEPDAKGRHPHGWSYRNLVRCKAPKAQEIIHRQGTTAARPFLPCIPGTRKGLRWLEFVSFDDVWRNRKVCVPGLFDPCRLLQLGCLDWSTNYYLKFGLRPELPATDDRKKERLKKADMIMLVAAFLAEYGYPLDYTMHLILERGTATLYAAEAKALYDYTGGKVVCCYTEMQGQLVAAWEEAKAGNPGGKGQHESWHNLLHNWEAALAGNVGSDRDRAPAVLQSQEREARALNTLALALTPEQRGRFKLPFPTFDEAHAQTLTMIDEINRREDHACEGFEPVTWWRLKGTREWQPESELVNVPEAVTAYLEYDPRVETPYQRMMRLSSRTTVAHVPPGSLLRSFLEDSRVVRPIKQATFAFQHEGRQYAYLADSPREALPEGTVLTGYFSPHDMSRILLTDEAGMFVGTWTRLEPARRGSAENAEHFRVIRAYMAEAVRRVQERHAPEIAAEKARMDGNLQVVAEAGLIPLPTARTLAQVEEHVAPGADRLAQAVERARRQTAAKQQAAAPGVTLSAKDFLPREEAATTHPGSNDEAPAAEDGEGFWMA